MLHGVTADQATRTRVDLELRLADVDMSDVLTGNFDTSQLPKVGSHPVTVTVARRIAPGSETRFEEWVNRTIDTVQRFPGCLGAGVLRPGHGGGEYQVVFRFVDAVALRNWERSEARADQLAEIAPIVQSMRVSRAVGVEQFFAAPGRAEIDRPWYHHLAIDTAWAFPVVVGSSLWVAPRLGDLPFSVRTALSMAAVGAVMRLVVFPVRGKVRRRTRLD